MATITAWVRGARPRTLPNAIAPVVVGAGAAAELGAFSWLRSTLALIVALALIVGVNYANDYSDGVRGTDDERVGPLRLVGSGTVEPKSVLAAALSSFVLACIAGLSLVVLSGAWWLLVIGAACVGGAWFYTGGKRPYGYAGFGEIAVFVFFGLAAVLGTVYVQAGTVSLLALGSAVAVGAFSSAVLLANNLRDIPSDTEAGKRTLAVKLGDVRTRRLYLVLVITPFAVTIAMAFKLPPALLATITALALIRPVRTVLSRATGGALIPVLADTGLALLLWAVVTGAVLTAAP
ncbi:1,4-dihydroxy-2-naphthoate polyprenyltransferase [Haloechinothrix salitolerans]|uniref:1,4-dihydroxy-2-naphthoate octaprenyltransferase n=1 Tax=Haloechinothrix salitolerans TaxID=926830 RepID=A0ABW2CA83_9PSEU